MRHPKTGRPAGEKPCHHCGVVVAFNASTAVRSGKFMAPHKCPHGIACSSSSPKRCISNRSVSCAKCRAERYAKEMGKPLVAETEPRVLHDQRAKATNALLLAAARWRTSDLKTSKSLDEACEIADQTEQLHDDLIAAIDAWMATFEKGELEREIARRSKP